jgi:hypothetical protein
MQMVQMPYLNFLACFKIEKRAHYAFYASGTVLAQNNTLLISQNFSNQTSLFDFHSKLI